MVMRTSLPDLIRKAREQLGQLTGLDVGSTVSVRKDDAGWCVQVEVVEKKSLPNSLDILATYEAALDESGDIMNFARLGMRRRMDVVPPAEVGSAA